ncbi:aminodeoxychorismate synthase component I [uncultured Cohaesibacter sp.]|uniref:aminodeoxychorismate synthase component I n=1 Tax=uncultured Cohaesibacter sp. TaxID=1002546 RepID=UPI00292D6BDD|nr:aminodeoxychorismate synthase component I [uncultured Cohaesibacter sp.]
MIASNSEKPIAPLFQKVPFTDPVHLLPALADMPMLAFLDSALPSRRLGRYSYLAFSPFATFRVTDGKAYWDDTELPDAPFPALQKKLNAFRLATAEGSLPPFQGGAMGYLAYEAGRLLERLPETGQELHKSHDILLPFYDLVLAIDHFPDECQNNGLAKAWIFSSGWPCEGKERQNHAEQRLVWFRDQLEQAKNTGKRLSSPPPVTRWRSNFSRKNFEQAIARTQDHIREGDIFQANITQRFSAPRPNVSTATPLAYYQSLRKNNPAPFAAFLNFKDHAVASSSPERFITLDAKGRVETRPIKGTAPRNLSDKVQDEASAKALENSEKDRAENIMITDLMRNDLSRVCLPGTIKEPQVCALESYAAVHHLVSTVTGEMKKGLGAVALLGASFPGGSITGAPKIRAMEIITELEDLPRNVYCGSIGYIGLNGAMDTNIAIRTATFKDNMIHFNVGGGITILSDPATEYEECLHKAAAIFKGFGTSAEAERESLEEAPVEKARQEDDKSR